MFITEAYAEGGGGGGALFQFLPIILIFAVFYFLLIRPRQRQMKQHQSMVAAVRRGDVVVTAGGLVGKVTRVLDGDEVLVELAENVRVRVVKSTLSDVRSKTEPAAREPAKAKAKESAADDDDDGDDEPDDDSVENKRDAAS